MKMTRKTKAIIGASVLGSLLLYLFGNLFYYLYVDFGIIGPFITATGIVVVFTCATWVAIFLEEQ